jgi:hypothetical protein
LKEAGLKRLLILVSVPVALWSTTAGAVDKAQCFDAASQGQTFRDAHKLLQARDQLRICASQSCPAQVQKDCSSWLDAVEQGLPTVVISAKDGSGRDLIDVAVTVDGQPFAAKVTGDAIPVDPGPHAFHFQTADGTSSDQQVLVREGVKNQSVDVTLGAPAAPAAPGIPAPLATPGTTGPALPQVPPAADTTPARGSVWKTVGWIAGGVGVVALGVGSVFGVMAISDKSNAHCDASNACDGGPLSDARNASTVSTIGVIAGGVLVAGGLTLILVAPKASHAPDAAVGLLRLAPMVGPGHAGAALGGSW